MGTSTQVLIVGAGLSGLTAAVMLGQHRNPTILIERRAETLKHPRADGFTPRTVEIYRSLGFSEEEVPEKPADFKLRRIRAESLTGKWYDELAWNPQQETALEKEYSPYRGAIMPQDLLEPILCSRAAELGVDIRLHHEFVGLTQDEGGVYCTINDRDGIPYQLSAGYVIAADGHRSAVRKALGVSCNGHGHVNSTKSVLFRAPTLAPYLRKGITQFTIDQGNLKALLLAYRDERLVLHLPHENREYTDATLRSLTYQALGKSQSELDVEILGSSRWDMGGFIADRFAVGRVFLVGDAAHSLPPNRGGYGVNTGIADAHNLAWKLAHVLHRFSHPQLLDTYEAERQPVAWLRHDQIFIRTDFKTLQKDAKETEELEATKVLDDDAVEFGQIYRSQGMLGVAGIVPDAQMPDDWAGQPGTRAPHVWICDGGPRFSTLQMFHGKWTLLSADERWKSALKEMMKKTTATVDFAQVAEPAFLPSFGVSQGGCSLVRPDGYIAWRTPDFEEPAARILEKAIRAVMFLVENPQSFA